MPELSSSVDSHSSASDNVHTTSATRFDSSSSRPDLRRHNSSESRSRGKEKHITPIDLEKIVISIKEKKDLEPLSPLQMPAPLDPSILQEKETKPCAQQDITPRPSSPPPHRVPESSTSTVATAIGSDISNMSPPIGSDASTATDISSHSVVRGFTLGRVSSSLRSRTQLAPPTPILKNSNSQRMELPKKKGATFTLGGSSDEGGDSSLDNHMQYGNHSILTDGLKKPAFNRKQPSFREKVDIITQDARSSESEDAIESDSEEDSENDNAIEEDDEDDEGEWEDEDQSDESGASSVNEKELFQRVDSRPNLTSRPSLLTRLMHEGDRAAALQNAASRSTPALRRSRTSSPNGPSLATSPEEDEGLEMRTQIPRSRPIIMTTSNTHPPALSPRTTRRNMLTTELTESLRKHLLWERQQKNSTTNAALKRRHTSNDVKNLKHYPGEAQAGPPTVYRDLTKNNNSWNAYFDHGLQEYHEKGW